MSALRSIVYVSTAVVPTTDTRLEHILADSRAYNVKVGVTGVLLCNEVNFMQCYEGPTEAVEDVRGRIARSTSHSGIIELLNTSIEARSFDDFQMGFARATASQMLRISTAQWKRLARREASADAMGFELLKQFWRNAR